MPIRTFETITIEFAGADPDLPGSQSDGFPTTRAIRLVESQTAQTRTFTLHDGGLPEYTLTAEETERLLHLLGQMEVTAPWQPHVGFDGTDYELALKSAMSSITFSWWVKVPAGWEGVGAVFDYVMAVADCRRAAAI